VLYQNYPNPFNPNTTIQFYILQKSQVTLDIYDNLGRHIRKLIDGVSYTTGSHSIEWDGKTELRDLAPSGVYYYKLKTADFQQTRKMLLIK
jgi:flagellar hook assembly protein FlgD